MAGLAAELADYLCSLRLRDIPQPVLDRLLDDVVDLVGCVLYGHEATYARTVVDYASADPATSSTIPGTAARSSSEGAALSMGVLGHAFDFDDYHPAAKLHPATVVLPAVFALGEEIGSTGEEVIVAAVAGFESMIRLSLASGPVATMLNGYHLTGICGGVGAAAGSAVLMGLGPEKTAHALGLAATQASGLMGFVHDGSDTKRLHPGRAAQSGILAAKLAAKGLTGPSRVFELEHGGFCHAFSPSPVPSRIVEALGSRWTTSEVSFKRWACCGSIHSTLDLILDAADELDIPLSDLDEIAVHHSDAVIAQCGWDYEPSDALHAQMSLKFCIAALILDGTVMPDQFQRERLDAPDIMKLIKKVTVLPDPRINQLYPEKFASRIVACAGDRSADMQVDHPKGSAERPLSSLEVDEKFRMLTHGVLSPQGQRDVISTARRIEKLSDIGQFMELLTGP